MPTASCPSCSTRLKVPETMAGRKAKCNKCGTTFQLPDDLSSLKTRLAPGGGRDTQLAKNNEIKAMLSEAPAAPSNGPVAKPKPKPSTVRSGRRPLTVALLAASLFLVLVGVLAVGSWYFYYRDTAIPDWHYFPDEPQFVVNFRPADIANTPLYKDALQSIRQRMKDDNFDPLKKIEEETSVYPADVESISIGGRVEGTKEKSEPRFVMVIRTAKAVSADAIAAKLKGQKDANISTVADGNYTIYRDNPRDDKSTMPATGLCVVSEKLVLLGTYQEVLGSLRRGKAPVLSPTFLTVLKDLDPTASFATLFDLPALKLKEKAGKQYDELEGLPMFWGSEQKLAFPEQLSAEIHIGKENKEVKMLAKGWYKDAKTADTTKAVIEDGLKKFKDLAVAILKLPKEQVALLDKLQFSVLDTRLVVTVQLDAGPYLGTVLDSTPMLLPFGNPGGDPRKTTAKGTEPGGKTTGGTEKSNEPPPKPKVVNPPPENRYPGKWTIEAQPEQEFTYKLRPPVNTKVRFEVTAAKGGDLQLDVRDGDDKAVQPDKKGLRSDWEASKPQTYTVKVRNLSKEGAPVACTILYTEELLAAAARAEPFDAPKGPAEPPAFVQDKGIGLWQAPLAPGQRASYQIKTPKEVNASLRVRGQQNAEVEVLVFDKDQQEVARAEGDKEHELTWKAKEGYAYRVVLRNKSDGSGNLCALAYNESPIKKIKPKPMVDPATVETYYPPIYLPLKPSEATVLPLKITEPRALRILLRTYTKPGKESPVVNFAIEDSEGTLVGKDTNPSGDGKIELMMPSPGDYRIRVVNLTDRATRSVILIEEIKAP